MGKLKWLTMGIIDVTCASLYKQLKIWKKMIERVVNDKLSQQNS